MEICQCNGGVFPTLTQSTLHLFQGGSLAEFVSVLARAEMKNIAEEICNNINNLQLNRADSMKAY